MKKKSPPRPAAPVSLFEKAILASLIGRAAGIEFDGNDTEGKLREAITKLSKKDGAA